MCGIVGIVRLNPNERADEARLKRMRDVLRHRGPDGEGLFLDGSIGLGHRRLAIVDVAGGHQPMANEDETIWIVYNGEIYNHLSLRSELEAVGHRYATRSDTETILHLYEEEGERCVERLQGMFAFALWDRPRARLLLARDRLGIKPLYYAWTGRELLFASEIKAILAAGVAPAFEEAVLPEFLANRFVADEDTFFRGVRRLLPGRTLSWSLDDGLREHRYWRLPVGFDTSPLDISAHATMLRKRLDAVVRSHLMSDVPVGLFLSGGIDSSGLAALMAGLARDRMRTFAVGFSEPDASELAYARLAARSVGAEHREIVVSPKDFFEALPGLIWHEDEPLAFPSSVPLHFVARLAREHVKVVLTGEGADELFLGYNRYRVTAWNERLGRTYWRLVSDRRRERVAGLVQRLPPRMSRYARTSFLARRPDPRDLYCEAFATFPAPLREELVADKTMLRARDPHAAAVACWQEGTGGTIDRMCRTDLQTYLVELLMKQDQMSMAASVESRVPFLDHELVEHVLAIPARFKLRGWQTKAVLRRALDGLVPPAILTRRKMGFPVPVGRWLRGPFWPLVEQFVLSPRTLRRGLFKPDAIRRLAEEHRRGVSPHGDRLWLLLNLEMWQRIFFDGEDIEAVIRAVREA